MSKSQRSHKTSRRSNKHHSNCRHHQQHNNCYGQTQIQQHQQHNNGQHQTQIQQQVKPQKMDQRTVDTQLLLDDTNDQIRLITQYLLAVIDDNKTKNQLKTENQKVVVGLQLFKLKVDGLREDKLDFKDAFDSSLQLIKEFEDKIGPQINKHKQNVQLKLMQRLDPCLSYMKKVLKNKQVPDIPYISDYTFDEGAASRVFSKIAYGQNHGLPERIKEINDNRVNYKNDHKRLKDKHDQSDHKDDDKKINHDQFIQDYDTNNYEFAKSKQELDKMHKEDLHKFRYKEPDIYNGTGNDSDLGNSDEDGDQEIHGNDI